MSETGTDERAALPLGADEFDRLMSNVLPPGGLSHLAAAVSGGADSMALMHLLAAWCRTAKVRLSILTVDHGLRREAAREARFVHAAARRHGLSCHVISLDVQQGAGLQARARDARYEALEDWCRENGADALVLGHHRGDQAETVLMRLRRGSDLWGLAGMRAVAPGLSPKSPPRLRPLLDVPKSRLRATLETAGESWVEDPSNADMAYERVRLRHNWPALEKLGLGPDTLAQAARRLGQAREALEVEVDDLLRRVCRVHPGGFARLDRRQALEAPRAVGLRALAQVLTAIGGRRYAPGPDRLEQLMTSLGFHDSGDDSASDFRGRTLAGCRICPLDDGFLLIVRESRGVAAKALAGERGIHWDRRFWVEVPQEGFAPGLVIDRLGLSGQRALRRLAGAEIDREIPVPARRSLPAIFDGSGLLGVPAIGFSRANTALPEVEFAPPVPIPSEIVVPWRLSHP